MKYKRLWRNHCSADIDDKRLKFDQYYTKGAILHCFIYLSLEIMIMVIPTTTKVFLYIIFNNCLPKKLFQYTLTI